MNGGLTKNGLIRKISKMAFGRGNDAVRLLFMDGEGLEALDGLELDMVSEIKRHANGAVEIKLVDRAELMSILAKLVEEQTAAGESGTDSFLRALELGRGAPAADGEP